jgi:hypothetical protein
MEPLSDESLARYEQLRWFPMRASLIAFVSATLLASAPAHALTSLEHLEISLQGEAKGWLNATCTYYGLGWIDEDNARQALTRLMQLIRAHHLGATQAEQAKAEALERDPGCQAIWPKSDD